MSLGDILRITIDIFQFGTSSESLFCNIGDTFS